jgi:alpha-beta hydrolase superfamily lysophospholipase
VVLYSPGLGGTRDSSTVLVEELVSRGYMVATIDHVHDSGAVEFPDGRVEVGSLTPDVAAQSVAVRVADTRFVLNTLRALNAGGNPDAEHRPLPNGLRGALNLSVVGMFGHSLGGATAAEAMFEDRRIKAGVNLDGTLSVRWSPPVSTGPSCWSAPRSTAGTTTPAGRSLGPPARLAAEPAAGRVRPDRHHRSTKVDH